MARRRGVSGFSPIAGRWALIALAVVVGASSPEARDRTESDRSWKASWEARQAREAERRRVEQTRRAYEFRRAIAHARMRSERGGSDALRASSPPVAEAMCPVLSDPAARREYQRQAHQWREQAFRRSSGLQPRTGLSVFSASKPSNPAFAKSVSPAMASTAHAVSTAVLASVAASASSSTGSARMVPLFPSASDARGRQGFARVINHSEEAGEVEIEAFDDEGMSYGPLTLAIDAGETVHFNSNDLEEGNANKGLTGSTGPGQGDWRLDVASALDIEVLSYIRTSDGFLTAMHDTVPVVDGGSEAAIFNPGSNQNQESLLRLVNPGDAEAVVTIAAIDDRGASPGAGVTVTLPAGSSATYTAAELESGGAAGLEGSIGDGAGKWRLLIESESDIVAMSLLSSPTGHLTNLSTAPDNEEDGAHAVPLFPSSSDAQGRQGFLRVMNRSDEGGEVAVRAFDDTDRAYETLTLAVGANETKHVNSDDLEMGNADKGLTGSTGSGEGDWRLELEGALDIEVLSYIRTTDGFLTAMHDVAPRSAKRHRVAVFNPGSNLNQQSLLRLVNPGDESAEVTIIGFDDRDASPGSDVVVSVPAGSSRTLTAAELETGGEFDGALGDGAGKWRLTVNADRAISAMSLLSSPTGHLTNLSTAPERGAGPVETAGEAHEALISPIVQSKCVNCHVEGGQSGNTPLVFVRDTDADYLAKNLSVFENYLAEVEGGADRILNKIQGALAHGGGVQVAAGTEEYAGFERFMGLLGADVEPTGDTLDNLFEGVRFESPRRTLWRAAIVFAGRIPRAEEYAAVEGGTDDDLRREIRGLMQGPEFHEFLIRGANDRLLTDRELGDPFEDGEGHFYDYTNKLYKLHEDAFAGNWRPLIEWGHGADFGAGRAPLELIAHVVENELSYKEVLTAPYIMANPMAADAYGAPTEFLDRADVQEFRPSEIVSYYRKGDGYEDEEHPEFGVRVLNPGPLLTEFPHAGILNTKVFLQRYPTTATNRNRARSRWTYYHFLGVDIENSESRTMDPAVLRDTNNPTLHNPACTACHARMDPVAGTFQNYGEVGLYRPGWGGLDALDEIYKEGLGGRLGLQLVGRDWTERNTVGWTAYLLPEDNTIAIWPEAGFGGISLDRLDVIDDSGDLVKRVEFEDLPPPVEDGDHQCGEKQYNEDTDQHDFMWLWGDRLSCAAWIDINDIPAGGVHTIEVTGWSHTQDDPWRAENGVEHGKVRFALDPYREGDTWYRGMREPGFVDDPMPDNYRDSSLQWLAQRIVEDDRFAEAAVKFWWPAIMGSEVVEQPQESDDALFEVIGSAAGAQRQEVDKLSNGFRLGFAWSDKRPYNLKDLLVEIALSKWFRAESLHDDDPVRREALRYGNAGARRLLTPEELARKTASVTGFQWGRGRSVASFGQQDPTRLNALADQNEFGLLYGGIDSDGLTERARDITSVMAAVANTHALASSCPIVLREFYLLPGEERRLFGGIDTTTSPVLLLREDFEVTADSAEASQEFSLRGQIGGGTVTVRFTKDGQSAAHEGETWIGEDRALDATTWADRDTVSWDVSLEAGTTAVAVWPSETYGGANLDRLDLFKDGEKTASIEFEDLPIPIERGDEPCGEKPLNPDSGQHDHLRIWGDRDNCAARLELDVESHGDYTLSVVGWGDEDSGGAKARLALALNPEPLPVVVVIDRLDIVDEYGAVVGSHDIGEAFDRDGLKISVEIPKDGHYDIKVSAWARNLGEEPGTFKIVVDGNDEENSAGAMAIKNKLVELHNKMFGIEVGPNSPDVDTAYRLFLDVWKRNREPEDLFADHECEWSEDARFLEGLLDDTHVEHTDDEGWEFWEGWDWGRARNFVHDDENLHDPRAIAGTWVVVLAYLLTDYRYLYL